MMETDKATVFDAEREIEEARAENQAAEQKKKDELKSKPVSILDSMSVEEMETHYSHCIKLCSDNKVNVKNAFKLMLIDYMKMVLAKKSMQVDNLPLMSCTLDASAKIYSCRVDKVYSDMSSILSRRFNNSKDDDEVPVKTKKKAAVKDVGSGEEYHSSDDEGDGTEVSRDFEARWNKILGTHESFQRGKAEEEYYGISLPRNVEYFAELPLTGPLHRLGMDGPLIDCNKSPRLDAIVNFTAPKFYGENFEDLGQYITGYDKMWENFTVMGADDCPKVLQAIDSEYVYIPSTGSSSLQERLLTIQEEEDDFQNDDNGGLEFEEIFEDDLMEGTDEGAKEVSKKEESKKEAMKSVTATVSYQDRKNKRLSMSTLTKLVSSNSSDYSFFDESKFKLWKRPDLWMLKRNRAVGKAPSKKSRAKKVKLIDFDVINAEENLRKLFESKGKYKPLSDKTLRDWSEKTYRLLPDIIGSKSKLTNCFKLEVPLLKLRSIFSDLDDERIDTADSEELTHEEFMEADDRDDDGDGDMFCEDGEEYGAVMEHETEESDKMNIGDGLTIEKSDFVGVQESTLSSIPPVSQDNNANLSFLSDPFKVPKVPIKFAKRQTRIDIKKVKEAMWNLISESEDKENNVIDSVLPNEKNNSNVLTGHLAQVRKLAKQEIRKPLLFSELLVSLPVKLPEEINSELSFAMAFMSLLHLSNEKSLLLKGSPEYDNVIIETES